MDPKSIEYKAEIPKKPERIDINYNFNRHNWSATHIWDLRYWEDKPYYLASYPRGFDGLIPEISSVIAKLAYRSELEWARPHDHKYHITSFPKEIQDHIMSYLLVPPRDDQNNERMLKPMVIKDHGIVLKVNLKICHKIMTKGMESTIAVLNDESLPPITVLECKDRRGSVRQQLYRIRGPPIDANVLAVSSAFHNAGARILYRQNWLFFTMGTEPINEYPDTQLFLDRNISTLGVYKPLLETGVGLSRRRTHWRKDVKNLIILTIRQLQGQPKFEWLMGWIRKDPFLLFLYTIGPKTAGLIRKLAFSSQIKLHACAKPGWYESCDYCRDSFVDSMCIYIPVILALCPMLENLAFFIEEDEVVKRKRSALHQSSDYGPQTIEDALKPFLCNEFRRLTTLRTFEIHGPQGVDMSFADETIRWVKGNAFRRDVGKKTL